jgi:hypothetical protein
MSRSTLFGRILNIGKSLLFQSSRAETAAEKDIAKLKQRIQQLKQQQAVSQTNNQLFKQTLPYINTPTSKTNNSFPTVNQPIVPNEIEDETEKLHNKQLLQFKQTLEQIQANNANQDIHKQLQNKLQSVLKANEGNNNNMIEFRNLSEEELKEHEQEEEQEAMEKHANINEATANQHDQIDVDALTNDSSSNNVQYKPH